MYLEEDIRGDSEGFHHPVRDLVEEGRGNVVLLQINRDIRLVRLPWLRNRSYSIRSLGTRFTENGNEEEIMVTNPIDERNRLP